MKAGGKQGPYPLFSREGIRNWFIGNYTQVKKEIHELDEEGLINGTADTLEARLYDKFFVEPPVLYFDETKIDYRDEQVEVYSGEPGIDKIDYKTRVTVVEYHVRFSGEKNALVFKSPTGILYSRNAWFDGSELIIEIPTTDYDVEKINTEFDNIKVRFIKQVERLTADIIGYNAGLKRVIKKAVDARYAVLSKKRDMLERIPYPLIIRGDVADVFKPVVLRRRPEIKAVAVKPSGVKKPVRYYLKDEDYLEVLRLINDAGKEFERHPGTFSVFYEPDFRNVILVLLQPRLEATATGETFNLSGKTDILIRQQSDVLFVAECKIWEGPEGYFDAIRQLYKYITWRDTRTAIVIFDRSKGFVSKNSVPIITPEFPDFNAAGETYDENWSEYIINKNGDRELPFRLNVLRFHIPTTE